MPSLFQPALDFVLDSEDGPRAYNITTDNNGGQVCAGINSKSFPSWLNRLSGTPQAERGPIVAGFYENMLWEPLHLAGLDSQDLANRVLDMATNAGQGTAAKELQQAINSLESGVVAVDGIIGPATIAAANGLNSLLLLIAFRSQRVAHYEEIAANNPANAPYLTAWLRRASA